MIRRSIAWIATLATIAAAVLIANAVAQDQPHVVEVSGLIEWSPTQVEAEVGDTVRWEFPEQGLPHNLVLEDPDGELRNLGLENGCTGGPAPPNDTAGQCPPGSPPIEHTFPEDADEGVYYYICTLHATPQGGPYRSGMVGQIVLGDEEPPPGPTPRLPNPTAIGPDGPDGEGWETGTEPPEIRNVRVAALRRGIRLRMNVSHPGRVNVRLRRGGRIHVNQKRTGLSPGFNQRWINRRALTPGRYNVVIRYFDRWGIQGEPRVVRRQVRFR